MNMSVTEDKVSVILPAFNAENTIETTIESIYSQDYKNLEIIAIDDASQDNTLNILKKHNNESKFKLISNNVNIGSALSRNKAIIESTGRYIAFIDSDDIWYPKKISKQINYMEEKRCPVSCTGYARYVNNTYDKNITPPSIFSLLEILYGENIFFQFFQNQQSP